MSAGWNLNEGNINYSINSKDAISNFLLRKGGMRNLYKLTLMKALVQVSKESPLDEDIFYKLAISFSQIYLELKNKLSVNTTIYNGRSKFSTQDEILPKINNMNFYNLSDDLKAEYVCFTKNLIKRNVLGALYKDLKEVAYKFDKKKETVYLNKNFKKFLIQHEKVINELINYRIIEFLKVSEKDKEKLKSNLNKIGISSIETDHYKIIKLKLNEIF